MDKFLILVPVADTSASKWIRPGAAVVAPFGSNQNESMLVRFEANLYGASNMMRFVEKCLHAADRAIERYPTTAKATLPVAELQVVGTFDYPTKQITEITDPDALRAWAGEVGDLKV